MPPKMKKADNSWMKSKSELRQEDAAHSSNAAGTQAASGEGVRVKLRPDDSSAERTRATKKQNADKLMGRPSRKRGDSQLGSKLGRRLGSKSLHWLKNNWILVALTIFAIIGVVAAIIIAATPCPDIVVQLQQERFVINTQIDSTSLTKCKIPNVEGTTDAYCPVGTEKKVDKACTQKCINLENGQAMSSSALEECPRRYIARGEKMCTAPDGCYEVEVETRCSSAYYCATTGTSEKMELECGSRIVDICKTSLGQVDLCEGTSCETTRGVLAVEGVCPPVSVCTYCVDEEDIHGNTLYEYPLNETGCGENRTRFVTLLDSNQICPPAIREIKQYVPMDGMILLDASGSVSDDNWDKMVDVGVKVVETFGMNVGPHSNHLKLGALAWTNIVSSSAIITPTSILSEVENRLRGWDGDNGGRPLPGGGTEFSNPLANCAYNVKYGSGGSNDTDAAKICMIVTDGANSINDYCTGDQPPVTSCTTTCEELNLIKGSTCTAENLAWELKNSAEISIVAACVGCSAEASKNIYCHSSCNTQEASIADCKSNLDGVTSQQLDDMCDSFIDVSEFNQLEAKLVELATGIGNSLASTIVTTTGNSHAPDVLPGNITASTEKSSRAAPAVTRQSSSNQTSNIEKSTDSRKCKDNRSWLLLLFFLPLLVYLLYFPLKVRADAKRARLRHLLVERKLLVKLKADEIRGQVAAQKEELKKQREGAKSKAKKKFKWDIQAADQYLWASSQGGGAMKVDFGKMGAPASAPRSHTKNKVLKMSDGTVLKGEAAEKAIKEMKEEEEKEARLLYEKEIALAEELERAGKLEEAGEFWLRLCPCCKEIMVEEDGADVFELEHHDVEKGGSGKNKDKIGHARGVSLFTDLQALNASNPAVTYG